MFKKELNNTYYNINAIGNRTVTIPLLLADWSKYKFIEVHMGVTSTKENIAPNDITIMRIDDLKSRSLIHTNYQEGAVSSTFTFSLNEESELVINAKLNGSSSSYSSVGIKGVYLSN